MNYHTPSPAALADVLRLIDHLEISANRRRDMKSGIRRICEMMGSSPALLSTNVAGLRTKLGKIRPARHEVTRKTFANQKSLFCS